MIRTGIFGGTFDPVHYGHIRLAETAYNELSLDKVIFMPAYIPPHKADNIVSDWEHRVNMLKLAISDIPYFNISFLEKELQGRSYTARTLSIPAVIRLMDSELIFGTTTPTRLAFLVRSIRACADGWYPVSSMTLRICSFFPSLT